jgi:hypothetical protein
MKEMHIANRDEREREREREREEAAGKYRFKSSFLQLEVSRCSL